METVGFRECEVDFAEFWQVIPTYSNLYHYAGNNPVKYTDPDGRMAEAVTANPSFWTGVCIILSSIAEDIVTLGVGLADDPATIALGVGIINLYNHQLIQQEIESI